MRDESGDLLLAVQEQNRQQKELVEKVIQVTELLSRSGHIGGQAKITQNMGGMLGWVCVVLCVAMMAGTLVGVGVSAYWAGREFNRFDDKMRDMEHVQRDQQDYLNVIYQYLPQLKPKEKK